MATKTQQSRRLGRRIVGEGRSRYSVMVYEALAPQRCGVCAATIEVGQPFVRTTVAQHYTAPCCRGCCAFKD